MIFRNDTVFYEDKMNTLLVTRINIQQSEGKEQHGSEIFLYNFCSAALEIAPWFHLPWSTPSAIWSLKLSAVSWKKSFLEKSQAITNFQPARRPETSSGSTWLVLVDRLELPLLLDAVVVWSRDQLVTGKYLSNECLITNERLPFT